MEKFTIVSKINLPQLIHNIIGTFRRTPGMRREMPNEVLHLKPPFQLRDSLVTHAGAVKDLFTQDEIRTLIDSTTKLIPQLPKHTTKKSGFKKHSTEHPHQMNNKQGEMRKQFSTLELGENSTEVA